MTKWIDSIKKIKCQLNRMIIVACEIVHLVLRKKDCNRLIFSPTPTS